MVALLYPDYRSFSRIFSLQQTGKRPSPVKGIHRKQIEASLNQSAQTKNRKCSDQQQAKEAAHRTCQGAEGFPNPFHTLRMDLRSKWPDDDPLHIPSKKQNGEDMTCFMDTGSSCRHQKPPGRDQKNPQGPYDPDPVIQMYQRPLLPGSGRRNAGGILRSPLLSAENPSTPP